jgi:hypothetical protein
MRVTRLTGEGGGVLGVGGWRGKGALERPTLPPSPPHQGVRQWTAQGQDPFRNMEALLKYVHRYGSYVYCTRSYWLLLKKSIKSLLNQSIFPRA